MKILARTGSEEVAIAYVGETTDGRLVEFTEAVQPPLSREEKWVLIVSSLFGCPARCAICDAGGTLAKTDGLSNGNKLTPKGITFYPHVDLISAVEV